MEEKIAERIATLEANNANIFHQLDEIKTDVKDIRRLTVAVEKNRRCACVNIGG